MWCIQSIDFHQPNPLVFSSIILYLILYKICKRKKNDKSKSFFNLSESTLFVIFFISLLPVICATPCDYPCCLYGKIKGISFVLFFVFQVLIKGLIVFAIIVIYWNFIEIGFDNVKKGKFYNFNAVLILIPIVFYGTHFLSYEIERMLLGFSTRFSCL